MGTHVYPLDLYGPFRLGACRWSKDHAFAWVNIPRNSSTLVDSYLKSQLWTDGLITDMPKDCKFLVVLRDPVERWASGMAEYMYRCHPGFDFTQVNSLLTDIIVRKMFFDEHALPQCVFIDQLPIENCVYFKMDNYLANNLSDYLQKYCNVADNTLQLLGKPNASENIELKQQLKNFFVDVALVPKYYQAISLFYESDIYLYNSVSFYQREKI